MLDYHCASDRWRGRSCTRRLAPPPAHHSSLRGSVVLNHRRTPAGLRLFLDDSTHPLSRFGQLVQHIVEIGSQLVECQVVGDGELIEQAPLPIRSEGCTCGSRPGPVRRRSACAHRCQNEPWPTRFPNIISVRPRSSLQRSPAWSPARHGGYLARTPGPGPRVSVSSVARPTRRSPDPTAPTRDLSGRPDRRAASDRRGSALPGASRTPPPASAPLRSSGPTPRGATRPAPSSGVRTRVRLGERGFA